jgi:LDH2 family malate/lactate/ureidoglycolate dehydrogenase
MDAILRMLKATPAEPGTERVLAPGDIERAHEEANTRLGIPLDETIAAQLAKFGASVGVAFPPAATRPPDSEPARA